MGWQSNHPWNKNRNTQFQRYNRKRQQNWGGGSHFNSVQDGTYSYNESWQQYPYQNNAYWQLVPQNPMYPISNRPHAGYRASHNGPHLPQYGNSNNSDGANQYYQGIEPNFQSNDIKSI